MDDHPGKEAIACFNTQAMPLLPALYRTALMLTHHEHSAEDLVQETMLRAYRHCARSGLLRLTAVEDSLTSKP